MSVTLSQMKAHLNISGEDDDALIQAKIDAASDWVGNYTGAPIAADSPAAINEAVMQLAAHLYENREASLVGVTSEELPFRMLDLLSPYRAWAF